MNSPQISVVIPVFNEEGNVPELHRRLVAVLESMEKSFELIFVDDGSRDASFTRLSEIYERDKRVRALRFSRNFGHHVAITAGLDAARGQAVVMMDADLEDQPEAIPVLFEKMEQGYDVVYGIRKDRKHSWFKRVTSRLFVALMNSIVAEGHSINTNIFRIARRPVVDAVNECREQYRFILGLFSWAGFRQTGVEVPHGSRFSGETKYSLFKMLRLALVTITAFSRLPLRAASVLGLIVSVFAFGLGSFLVLKKFLWDTMIEGWTSAMVSSLFIGGVQLVCLGILGEYVGRIYGESQKRPLYVVSTRLE
jgi:dolichol-phosphate mannosyltransferase